MSGSITAAAGAAGGAAGTATNRARTAAVAMVALTGLALALRATSITRSLFIDETYSLALAQRGFGHMIALAGYEPNGMPYSIVLWPLIRMFGTSEALLRLPSVIAGTASVPALWWTARRLGAARAAAFLAAALLAVNPMAIWYSQTARPYSFVLLFGCVAFGSLANAAMQPRRRGPWIAYVGAMAGLAYSNLFAAPIVLPAQALIARRGNRGGTRSWAWSLLALLTLCVPLLTAAAIARSRRNALYWLPKLSRELVELGLQEFTAGFSDATAVRWVTLAAGGVLVAGAAWRLARRRSVQRDALTVAACWGLLPGAILLAISAVEPVFWPRYAIVGLPGLCLLGALAAEAMWTDRRRIAVASTCLAIVLGAALYADARQVNALQEEWRPIASWLRAERTTGQPTIVDKALVLPSLGYYDRAFRAPDGALIVQEWHDRPLPAGFVGFKDPGGYGSVPDGPPSAAAAERLARRGHGTLWMIFAKVDTSLQGAPSNNPAVRWAEHHCRVQMRESVGVQAFRATSCKISGNS